MSEAIHEALTDRWLRVMAIVFGLVITFADARLETSAFTPKAVIVLCFVLGWMRPARPWRWAGLIVGVIVLAHALRFTPLAALYWSQLHQIGWLGRTYDLFGTPLPQPFSLSSKLLLLIPGVAAALLGRWGQSVIANRRARESQ